MGTQVKEGDFDHFCEGCERRHGSAVWHYRHSPKETYEFICETAYKALNPMEQARWFVV